MLPTHNRATIESNLRKVGGLTQSQIKQVFRGTSFAADPKKATVTHQGLEKFLGKAAQKVNLSSDKVKVLYHSIRKETERDWKEHPELHTPPAIQREQARLAKLKKQGVDVGEDDRYKSRTQELAESRKAENIRARIMESAREERKEVNEQERADEEESASAKGSGETKDKKPDFQIFTPPPVMPI